MKRRIITALIVLLALAAAVRLVRLRKQQLASQRAIAAAAIPVETARVTRGDYQGSLVCYGVISSVRQATVRARTGGVVSLLHARENDGVDAGEPLLELDGTPDAPRDGRAATAAAVTNLERSVASLERTVANLAAALENDRMLRAHEAISALQLEASENRYEEARVRLAGLRSELAAQRMQLDWFTVRAPFAGRVAEVLVDLGDVVTPAQPLLRLQDDSPCRVRATVAAADLSRIAPGAPAVLVHAGHVLEATVGRIHPAADAAGTGTVEVPLPEPPFGLPLGASVEVRLPVDVLPDVLLVPAASVLAGPGSARVHVVEADTVRVVPVTVLAASGETAAVAGDLSTGMVLVRGSDSLLMRLADGVRVAPQGEAP